MIVLIPKDKSSFLKHISSDTTADAFKKYSHSSCMKYMNPHTHTHFFQDIFTLYSLRRIQSGLRLSGPALNKIHYELNFAF